MGSCLWHVAISSMISVLKWQPLQVRRRNSHLILLFKIFHDYQTIPHHYLPTQAPLNTRSNHIQKLQHYQSWTNVYVIVWAITRHVRTQTEIHFIAPAYSYTKQHKWLHWPHRRAPKNPYSVSIVSRQARLNNIAPTESENGSVIIVASWAILPQTAGDGKQD